MTDSNPKMSELIMAERAKYSAEPWTWAKRIPSFSMACTVTSPMPLKTGIRSTGSRFRNFLTRSLGVIVAIDRFPPSLVEFTTLRPQCRLPGTVDSGLHSFELLHEIREELFQRMIFESGDFFRLGKHQVAVNASAMATAGKTRSEPAIGPEKITS